MLQRCGQLPAEGLGVAWVRQEVPAAADQAVLMVCSLILPAVIGVA